VINEVSKVLFIVNKYAGAAYQPVVEGRIIEGCEQHNIEYSIEFTQARAHATTLARKAVSEKGFSHVIAVGGDGTVNEVAAGLLHSTIIMGIIPIGSGNGLARHLQIPMTVSRAVKSLFNSQTIAMDTFELNGKLSLNVSGIGFDGHIANLFAKGKKRGLKEYVKHVLREFVHYKEFQAEIRTEQQTMTRKAFVIAIANSSQYGNNARIAPAASVCDQLLHISILKKVPPYRIDFIYSFFTGKIDQSVYCEILETNRLTINVRQPVAYHIDGEPGDKNDAFVVALLPASLRMLVPAITNNP
jgi:YegS/Rv2252/BmrU family lipid kinase